MGEFLEGTNDENGCGRKDVVLEDGLAHGGADSGSASQPRVGDSGSIRGSAGVKKDFGEVVISSHMSRNLEKNNGKYNPR